MKWTALFTLLASVVVCLDSLAELNHRIKQIEARLEAHEQLKSLSQNLNLSSLSNADIEAAAKLIMKNSSVKQTSHILEIDKEIPETFTS